MAYSAMQVANAFIQKAQSGQIADLTPMKLQKLMFFAQSWYLRTKNTLLFNEAFARWQFGPVIPDLYQEFRGFGASVINRFACDALGNQPQITEPSILAFLDKIIEVYGQYTGPQLSAMTHEPGTAWSINQNCLYIDPSDLLIGRL
ncbi:Panacea domain-containing protein [Ursidibacter arcticus]